MLSNKDLILQAIESAERSLSVARELLGGGVIDTNKSQLRHVDRSKLLGEIGTFDGENLVTDNDTKFQVPPNYASKSLLVAGDVMRMVVGSDGVRRFKQIQKVPRLITSGILTKKDGLWSVVSDQGTFRVLPASVKYFGGEIGDEIRILLPKNHRRLRVKWAALKEIINEAGDDENKGQENREGEKDQKRGITGKTKVAAAGASRQADSSQTDKKSRAKTAVVVKPKESKEEVAQKKKAPKLASRVAKKEEGTKVRDLAEKPGAEKKEGSQLKGEIKVSAAELR